MTSGEQAQKKFEIGRVFTPSAPIDTAALFAGRKAQISKLINAINQRGQHAVLFGERGVGKTSLANVLKDILSQNELTIPFASTNCDSGTDFRSMWNVLLPQLPIVYSESGIGFSERTNIKISSLADLLDNQATPETIRQVFKKSDGETVIIIDELDQIQKKGVTNSLAATIKTLSDHSTPVTLILVGVADSVETLITEHASIERALVQIPMPRMSVPELTEIITKGMTNLNMAMPEECKTRIARLSHGLPHYTHSLGLYSAQAAIDRDTLDISDDDVTTAVQLTVENAQQSIRSNYHQATSSGRTNLYPQVLLACALAETDDLGYFSSANVREPMSKIMKKPYDIPAFSQHLNDFCGDQRGGVLQKTGHERRYRFRFVNPLMEPYVVMKGISSGMIESDALDRDNKVITPTSPNETPRLL